MRSLPKPSRLHNNKQNTRRITRKTAKFRFVPKSDMTVWEFARFIAMLVDNKPIHFKSFFQLLEPLQRHFRQIKNA